MTEKTKVLDLACGKGAVSVKLAKAFGFRVKGIDLIGEFIDYARKKAAEYGVAGLCSFAIEDINLSVTQEKDYDLVILGAVGDVLGNPRETLLKLRDTVRPGGYIILDDAYSAGSSDCSYPTREQWHEQFQAAGVRLVAEKIVDVGVLAEINRYNQECIVRRANELIQAYPQKADLFAGYIQSQQEECDELEADGITGVTVLLQSVSPGKGADGRSSTVE